jgi:hypothetical protein
MAQAVQVYIVIGMQVGNHRRPQVTVMYELHQPAERAVAGIQQDITSTVLQEVTGTGPPCGRVGSPAPQYGNPHDNTSPSLL